MPSDYVAPFPLSPRTTNVPSGTFTVPVCTTPERFDKIMNALFYYGSQQQEGEYDLDHLVDWLAACNNIVEGCAEVNPVCRTISPTSDLLTWYPESPYHQVEPLPAGYAFHPWTVADSSFLGLITWGLGYKVGDVFTDLSKVPDFTDPENIASNYLGLPSVMIDNLQGEGTVKAHLLSIPFGGRIIVIIDENPPDLLNLISVELDRDSLSFPPETAVELVIDTEIHGEGTHSIRYVWYPVVAIELPPVAFGGGVRSFELCGFGVTTMPDENCCDDQLNLTNTTNILLQRILDRLDAGWKLVPNTDGQTDSIIFGDCFPSEFDNDADDVGDEIALRERTLCWIVESYIYGVLIQNLLELGAPSQTVSVWEFAFNSPFIFSKLKVNGSFLTWIVFMENAATLGTVVDAITCVMLNALKGKITSYAPFRDSIVDSTDPNPFVSAIYHMLYYSNHQKDNFTLFVNALEQTFEANNIPSGFVCPCTDVTPPVAADCGDISLVDFAGTGCTIEYISDCIWKFTNNAINEQRGILAHHFSFRDVANTPLLVSNSDQPTIGTTSGQGGCEVVGACGAADYHGYNFGGGLTGGSMISGIFWQGNPAPVTYLKIEAFTCP